MRAKIPNEGESLNVWGSGNSGLYLWAWVDNGSIWNIYFHWLVEQQFKKIWLKMLQIL